MSHATRTDTSANHLQVSETEGSLDSSKLRTLGAFMEQVLAADPEVHPLNRAMRTGYALIFWIQLPSMMDQLFDDSTELIATLLSAAESASHVGQLYPPF